VARRSGDVNRGPAKAHAAGTTMNVYGDVVTDEMEQAHSKVVGMALATVN
jgi:hypothetical protein